MRRLLVASLGLGVLGAWGMTLPAAAQAAAAPAQAPGDAPPGDAAAKGPEAKPKSTPQKGKAAAPQKATEATFDKGVAAYRRGAATEAATLLFTYIEDNEPTEDQYEWAEFFLAQSLERMGLYHGATEYYYVVAKEQKRPEILPKALAALERLMERRAYDEEMLVDDLLASSEFGSLPDEVRTFVEYHQGRRDLLDGRTKWASRHLEWLTLANAEDNRFAQKYIRRASFAKALTTLTRTHDKSSTKKREQRAEALTTLDALAAEKEIDPDLKNDIHRTVARLHYEEGRYTEALAAFEKIEVPFLSRDEANLFLEKAWARYFAGDHRGTLGILLSLEAPSYRRYFKPERFILKALAYQGLCHYAAAKGSAREFLRRYGQNLNQLKRSRDPLTDPVIRRAAVQRRGPKRVLKYLKRLQYERTRVQGMPSSKVKAHLAQIYDFKLKEVVRRLDRIVKDEAIDVAESLLDYEEQARLLDYEISLEVFRRVRSSGKAPLVADVDPPIPLGSQQVYYPFNGEYWNDELHNYRFRVESRCVGERLFQ